MRATGSIIGAVVGFLLLKSLAGAALGAVVGYLCDLWLVRGAAPPGAGPREQEEPAAISQRLFATAFAVMGYLAKADGHVSEAEIGAARTIMRQMNLDAAHVERAIAAFTRGKQPDYPIEAELAALRAVCGPRHDLLRMFLEIQVRAALAGNDLKGPVRGVLLAVAQRLGFGGLEVARIEAALRLQQGRGWTAPPPPPGARLKAAYETLGIAASASDADLKKAYRRQMNENHPDKLVARGFPESMQEIAKEKTQQIKEAYEAICEHRGIR